MDDQFGTHRPTGNLRNCIGMPRAKPPHWT
jgi:hypothetical protein